MNKTKTSRAPFTQLTLTAALLLSFGIAQGLNSEKKTTCNFCESADKLKFSSEDSVESSVDAAAALLSKFKASKDKTLRKKEIHALLALAARALPKNDEGQVDDYLFDIYQDYKVDMDAELKQMRDSDQKKIRESLEHMKKVSKEGNG